MSFEFDFTEDKLKECVPTNKNISGLFNALSEILPKYDITTPRRVAGFLAQCGHECMDFNTLHENLNYSADGLHKVFPKRFPTVESAQPYNRQPEKIANKIYSDRMGNGDEASGEGYKFRGRGAIQLTGKDNYSRFAESIGKDLDEAVAYCDTLEGAIESACWFWTTHNLNAKADENDVTGSTKVINGGTLGIDDRKARWLKALKAFN
jgi:putative chitinase